MVALVLLSMLAAPAVAYSVLPARNFPGTGFLGCLAQKPLIVLSCENTTAIKDTCCSPTPGGLVLSTQFWDLSAFYPGQYEPSKHWTLHGLWPDNCNGSYNSYCDLSRNYTGPQVQQFLEEYKAYALLDYMNTYWINQGGPNSDFWAHEFSKHATCFSTFDPTCYPGYRPGEDVVNFFDTAVRVFQDYPTYDWLAAADITPSNSTTYTLAAIQAALQKQTGAVPYIGCYKGSFDEVWYYSHSYGPPQLNQFKHINSTTPSTCPSTGIHYYERVPGSEH